MSAMYSRLDLTRNEIRTVVLHSGTWDDEITCSLQIASLDEKPEYSALSYVWGDPSQTANIIVDSHVVQVRTNLQKALRRIRNDPQGPRVMWIDSLSINQKDNEERSQQIPIMGRIYKSSKSCIVWMGEVEEEPIQPFRRLERPDPVELNIMERLIRDLKLTTPEPLRNAGKETASIDIDGAFEVMELIAQNKHFYEMPFFRILPTGGIELCEIWSKAVYSLENILQRTWWKRIWTVQEAFLPNQAQLHIGPHSYPYMRFVDGAKFWESHVWSSNFILGGNSRCCLPIFDLWMGYISHEIKASVNRVRDLATLRELRANMGIKPVAHHLFMLSIQRSATLRHDHVYGLFGLITEFFQIDEKPDYSKDPTLLYARTTIKFMENAKNLCLLPYARPQHCEVILTEEQEFLRELPSWCPDWSTYAWGDYFDIYNFGGFTADKLLAYNGTHQGETILKLEGIAVDKIPIVGRLIGDMKTSPSEFVPIIQEWLDLTEGKGLSPRALWEIIHVATHKDKGPKVVDLQAAWWELLKGFAKNGTSRQEMQDAAKETPYIVSCRSMEWLDKRAVFTTEPNTLSDKAANPDEISEYRSAFPRGSIGLALPNVCAGDFVFIVKGGRTPLILRPLSDDSRRLKAVQQGVPEEALSNCFTFVGVCYIYGMMQGQAVAETPSWEQIYLL